MNNKCDGISKYIISPKIHVYSIILQNDFMLSSTQIYSRDVFCCLNMCVKLSSVVHRN